MPLRPVEFPPVFFMFTEGVGAGKCTVMDARLLIAAVEQELTDSHACQYLGIC